MEPQTRTSLAKKLFLDLNSSTDMETYMSHMKVIRDKFGSFNELLKALYGNTNLNPFADEYTSKSMVTTDNIISVDFKNKRVIHKES